MNINSDQKINYVRYDILEQRKIAPTSVENWFKLKIGNLLDSETGEMLVTLEEYISLVLKFQSEQYLILDEKSYPNEPYNFFVFIQDFRFYDDEYMFPSTGAPEKTPAKILAQFEMNTTGKKTIVSIRKSDCYSFGYGTKFHKFFTLLEKSKHFEINIYLLYKELYDVDFVTMESGIEKLKGLLKFSKYEINKGKYRISLKWPDAKDSSKILSVTFPKK